MFSLAQHRHTQPICGVHRRPGYSCHDSSWFLRWHWGNLCIEVDASSCSTLFDRNLWTLFKVLCVGLSILNLKLFDACNYSIALILLVLASILHWDKKNPNNLQDGAEQTLLRVTFFAEFWWAFPFDKSKPMNNYLIVNFYL